MRAGYKNVRCLVGLVWLDLVWLGLACGFGFYVSELSQEMYGGYLPESTITKDHP